MKNRLVAIGAIICLTFTSCYVGVEGRRPRHRHGTRVEIRTSENSNQKDSVQSRAMSEINPNDSIKAPVNSGTGKQ